MYHQDCKSFQTFCRTDQGPNLSLVEVLSAALLNVKSDNDPNNDKILASILIDADADGFTPAVVEEIHGFLLYEMSGQRQVNSRLVIGSEGGGVLVTLAGGSRNITAEELNHLLFRPYGNLTNWREIYMIVMKSICLLMMA
jgi:hypothetical protein